MVILRRLAPQDDDKVPGAGTEEPRATEAAAAPVPPPPRPSSRSIPPPIPTGPRRQRSTTTRPDNLVMSRPRPDAPTVVEHAIANRQPPAARAMQLAQTLTATEAADPRAAAVIAYELGEL